jgi:hypothetical protein
MERVDDSDAVRAWSFSFSCWSIHLLMRGWASMLLEQLATFVASCDVQFQPCGGALSLPLFVRDCGKVQTRKGASGKE